MFSPHSQAILNKLLSGESVTSGSVGIAKLDDIVTRPQLVGGALILGGLNTMRLNRNGNFHQ